MKISKLHIAFILCTAALLAEMPCSSMTVTESSIKAHASRSPLGQAISSLEIYNITRQMPTSFQVLTENSTSTSYFRIESIDEMDARCVIQNLADTTNRIFLEYDGYGDLWVAGIQKIEEVFIKAYDMADSSNKDVILFFSHADFLIDWGVATEFDDKKLILELHRILRKYKERHDVRLIVHTKLLDGYVARPWWSDAERIKLELPDTCERGDLIISAFAKEGIFMEKEYFDRIVEYTDGLAWTQMLSGIRETIADLRRHTAGVVVIKLHESIWTKSMRQYKNMLYPIHKFFKRVSADDIVPVVATVTIAGGCLALIVHLHRIEQAKSEKIKKELLAEKSLQEELDQQQTTSCIS